ncbi:MAG: L-aspartate oxidase [Phycisphaerales bacterium]|jgi:L-aspartate oxidase|nr:L-aspartate oxidase [Phycisphaerales bacterium]MBT7171978.1 L-aspartate oxidase [Phycisphaerales bacterium]
MPHTAMNPYLHRRYLVSFSSWRIPQIFTDVLIIGSGVGGLLAAIEAADTGVDVILVTKSCASESNSYYAQGGMAVAVAPDDSIESHIDDTLSAGAGLCDESVVRECLSSAEEIVESLLEWGMEFDGKDGAFRLGREGAHTANRILHADGDATGRVLIETLLHRVNAHPHIKLFDECFVLDLLTDPPDAPATESRCVGVLCHHPRFGMQILRSGVTILAAGGAGKLWRETSNPSCATGDGIAMAFRAGVEMADMELMQFHPTTLYVAGASRALISEAVRGEGGYLVDRRGKRFMQDIHPMAELAPRDIVSRAILAHLAETQTTAVYLDVRHLGSYFQERFPGIARTCREFDLDPAHDLIPVHPAAHYMIGGLKVDLDGQTSLPGLLACGEAACSFLHGANRLASNSLTEAMVFGRRCGALAASLIDDTPMSPRWKVDWSITHSARGELDMNDILNALRAWMWRNVGVVRDGATLEDTKAIIEFWGRYVLDKEFFASPSGWEVQNMLTASWLVTKFALDRTETRGVHYRLDYPQPDEAWVRHLSAIRQSLRESDGE